MNAEAIKLNKSWSCIVYAAPRVIRHHKAAFKFHREWIWDWNKKTNIQVMTEIGWERTDESKGR